MFLIVCAAPIALLGWILIIRVFAIDITFQIILIIAKKYLLLSPAHGKILLDGAGMKVTYKKT